MPKTTILSPQLGLLIFSLIFTLSLSVYADIPQTINYQGILTDNSGNLITDSSLAIQFKLYKDSNSDANNIADNPDTEIWNETHSSVNVQDGRFSVILGSIENGTKGKLGSKYFTGQYWLEIIIDSTGNDVPDQALSPKLKLTSSPYALDAERTRGSSVTVNCGAGGSGVQAALKAGASTIVIDGTCNEAIEITRDKVQLIAEGNGTDKINGAADGKPAIEIFSARGVKITGLAISDADSDAQCLNIQAGAVAELTGLTLDSCMGSAIDLDANAVAHLSNSTISNNGAGEDAINVAANSTLYMFSSSITNYGDSAIDVSDSSIAEIGNEDTTGIDVTISSSSGGNGIDVEGNSYLLMSKTLINITGSDTWDSGIHLNLGGSAEVVDSTISVDSGYGINMPQSGSLTIPFWAATTTTLSGGAGGIFLFSGTANLGSVNITSSSGDGVELHNSSELFVNGDTDISGASGRDGIICYGSGGASLNVFHDHTGTISSCTGFCSCP